MWLDTYWLKALPGVAAETVATTCGSEGEEEGVETDEGEPAHAPATTAIDRATASSPSRRPHWMERERHDMTHPPLVCLPRSRTPLWKIGILRLSA